MITQNLDLVAFADALVDMLRQGQPADVYELHSPHGPVVAIAAPVLLELGAAIRLSDSVMQIASVREFVRERAHANSH